MEVIVGENEPLDRALGRFRRKVLRSGLFREMRHRRYHEGPSDKRKRKLQEAQARRRRMERALKNQFPL